MANKKISQFPTVTDINADYTVTGLTGSPSNINVAWKNFMAGLPPTTGYRMGGTVSINADPTKFDVAASDRDWETV